MTEELKAIIKDYKENKDKFIIIDPLKEYQEVCKEMSWITKQD